MYICIPAVRSIYKEVIRYSIYVYLRYAVYLQTASTVGIALAAACLPVGIAVYLGVAACYVVYTTKGWG